MFPTREVINPIIRTSTQDWRSFSSCCTTGQNAPRSKQLNKTSLSPLRPFRICDRSPGKNWTASVPTISARSAKKLFRRNQKKRM
ncbi:hypothetical protein CEXT_468081 [Caerostris extrusa]|uniref:Uncharacterized protein n=1 Tax=Caerostris extrusa TaxID=172846 RepID=A0AAV4XVL1_CAEEX|nr:hypothetical protein CEXT_468081 [Caerostris extrusa]